jgi:hypothetical protein
MNESRRSKGAVGGLMLGLLVLAGPLGLRAEPEGFERPDFEMGQVAPADILVPSGVNPIDRGLGLGLSSAVPTEQIWVYRRDLGVTARVVEALQADFVRTQDRFRRTLIEAFGELPVNRRDVNSVRFRSLQATFQNENDGFPVNYQLAVAWAYELDDSHFFLPVSLSVFECFVGRAVLPDEAELPDYVAEVLILPANEGLTDDPVQDQLQGGVLVGGTSVDSVSVIRERVYRALAGESLVLADFVSRRIRANAAIDEALTMRLREERMAVDALADRLTEGSLIVKQGEVINENHLELLAALENAMAPLPTDSRGDPDFGRSFFERFGFWLLITGLAVLVGVGWVVMARRHGRSRLPVLVRDPSEQGAGFREARAEDSVIVQALRDKTVQALYSQRQEFLRHEQSATELLRELEQVIANLEPRTQDKIRQYETRIRDLEQQLADKEDENRELIRVQIESTRRDIARTLSGAGWEAN